MTNNIEYKIASLEESQKTHTIQLRISENNQMYTIHKAIVKQLNEQRQGNANCKTRSQVRGGGRKPWKQKGTGRARVGSIRSPLWRGGGVIFGPKTKEYNQKINKKERQLAIRNMLYNKKDFTIAINQSLFKLDQPKTKMFLETIKTIKIDHNEKILIVMAKKHINTYLSARNLNNIEIIAADQINLLSIIKAKHILIEVDAIKIIEQVYNGQQ